MPFFGLFGPPDIKKLKEKKKIDELIKALLHQKDEKVRARAAEALGQLEEKKAVPDLVHAYLQDSHKLVRIYAVAALGEIGGRRAVDALSSYHYYSNLEIRKARVKALVKIGDCSALDGLILFLKKLPDRQREATMEVLIEIGSTNAVNVLLELLKDPDDTIRRHASNALVKIGKKVDIEKYLPLLADKNAYVREAAAETLGRIGDSYAVEALVKLLKDKSSKVRIAAIRALGKIGDSSAVDSLTPILVEKKSSVRYIAATVLYKIGVPRAYNALLPLLSDPDERIRKIAVNAVGEIGDPKSIDALLPLLADSNIQVQRAADQALKSMNWHPETINDKMRILLSQGKWEDIVELGKPAIPFLINMFQKYREQYNHDEAAHIIDLVGKIGDPETVEFLINCLDYNPTKFQDKEQVVKKATILALGRIGDTQSVDHLMKEFPDFFDHQEALPIEKTLLKALGKIGGEKATQFLIRVLKSNRYEIKSEAAIALGETGDPRAVDTLEWLLLKNVDGKRKIAALVLKNMGWQPETLRERTLFVIGTEQWQKWHNQLDQTEAIDTLINALQERLHGIEDLVLKSLGKASDPKALEAILPYLEDYSWNTRKAAAEALIAIYKGNTLSEEQKQTILNKRSMIRAHHHDRMNHTDLEGKCDNPHTDSRSHRDSGIGLDFSL